ncbi:MAG TPA: hypothetical protein VM223_13475 [Planctomycetota bacterium]|nr:hypothetical protein [Planctomycetota bacterium]
MQQIGELSREFRQGEVVYNREVTIYRPLKAGEQPQAINTPAQFITLGFKPKRWAERTQGGSGRIAYSEEEVIAMGGALTYGDHATNKKPWFQTLATMVGLLRKPEHLDDTRFPFEFNGTFWTFFEWGMKGSAYTDGAREIYSQRRIGSLRKSWMAHVWNLTTSLKDYPNGNSAYVPRLRPGALCGPEFQAWILDVLRGEEASELESMDESND